MQGSFFVKMASNFLVFFISAGIRTAFANSMLQITNIKSSLQLIIITIHFTPHNSTCFFFPPDKINESSVHLGNHFLINTNAWLGIKHRHRIARFFSMSLGVN